MLVSRYVVYGRDVVMLALLQLTLESYYTKKCTDKTYQSNTFILLGNLLHFIFVRTFF